MVPLARRVATILAAAVGVALVGSCKSADPAPAEQAGALVRTTVTGRVAVLLDTLPPALRDRAAQVALARPASFWVDRATKQVRHTKLRLTFRRYYAVGLGQANKAQLPLPPESTWQFAFDRGGAARTTVDGHDVVAIGYTMTSTLLTDAASPAVSEPALAAIGGAWDEPFVMPLDPTVLFQLTGYSCMRESDTPTASVDGEDTEYFYDQDCMGQGYGLQNCHYTVPSTPLDCRPALKAAIGTADVDAHFERLAWDPKIADAVRVGRPTSAAPDLAVDVAAMGNNRVVYRYFPPDSCALAEGCVAGNGWRRLLQFDADVVDVGKTALDIGQTVDSPLAAHNVFYFSPCHKHVHFRFYGDFALTTGNEPENGKKAFCLLSTSRVANDESSPLDNPYDLCKVQGIAPGWRDEYEAGLDCQWIDVTDVDTSQGPVEETVSFHVNPEQFLCEGAPVKDAQGGPVFEPTTYTSEDGKPIDRPKCSFTPGYDANNLGTTKVTLPVRGGYVTEPCARGQMGPTRDCGFTEAGPASTCAPGATVHLSCAGASAAAPAQVRVCEASAVLGAGVACAYHDALAGAVLPDGAAVDVTFTCPSPRDDRERGGRYALYASPVFDGDVLQPLNCTVTP